MPQKVCCLRFYDNCCFPRRLRRAAGRNCGPLSLRKLIPAILILLVTIPSCFARQGRTCGVDALYQICLHYKLPIQYEEVYAACKPNDEGNSMYDLFQAAQNLGFSVVGMRLSYEELLKQESPCIAFVDGNHFVAVVRGEHQRLTVIDYPEPPKTFNQKDFEGIWGGECLVVSGTGQHDPQEINGDLPRIVFDSTLQDFGVISEGDVIQQYFIFSNVGNTPLVIDRIKSSCACTGVLLSSTTVEPCEIGELVVEFDSHGYRGRQSQHVALTTNDPENPLVVLTISGIVHLPFEHSPKRIYLSRIMKGSSVTRRIVMKCSEDVNLEIVGLECDSPFVKLRHEIIEDESQVEFGLTVIEIIMELDTIQMPLGNFRSEILIHTSVEDRPLVQLPVSAQVVGELRILPRSLFLGRVYPCDSVKRSFCVSSASGNPFAIKGIEHSIAGLEIQYSTSAYEDSHIVKVEFGPLEQTRVGAVESVLKLYADLPNDEYLEVPVFVLIENRKL